MGPQDGFLQRKLGIMYSICPSWASPAQGIQPWTRTDFSHLGADLWLHHGPHHRSPTSTGAFHFHLKCLAVLIQKLGRDKLVRMQVEWAPNSCARPRQQPARSRYLAKPINLVKSHLSWSSALSHFKDVCAEKPLASMWSFNVPHQEEEGKCNFVAERVSSTEAQSIHKVRFSLGLFRPLGK